MFSLDKIIYFSISEYGPEAEKYPSGLYFQPKISGNVIGNVEYEPTKIYGNSNKLLNF